MQCIKSAFQNSQKSRFRRRTLASIIVVTSLFMLFLSQNLPHSDVLLSALPVQRRNLILAEREPDPQMSPELKRQEEELLSMVKDIASGIDRLEYKKPEVKKEKPPPVQEPKKEAVPDTVKERVVEAKVEEKIQIVNLFHQTTEIKNNTQYPPHLHPDRFKFIYKRERVSKEGPKVNLIPDQTTWRHELNHVTVCNATDPLILAIVISAVTKRELRDYIRNTWANPRLYPYTKIRPVFIVGATTDTILQEEVDKEYAKYNDIIQYNFIDSYGNLTYKSMAWLKWVGKNCPQAQFIAKIDDDVMVNPFHLRTYFEEKLKDPPIPQGPKDQTVYDMEPGANIATTYIYGRYDGMPYPLRYTKWAVTKEEYPEGEYAPFVHGPAYVVGRVAAKLMLEYAPYVPYLKLEDVYTTGLVAHAAQVRQVQINGHINTFQASIKLFNGTQALMEETHAKSRQEAWEGIVLYAPVNIKDLGTPWT